MRESRVLLIYLATANFVLAAIESLGEARGLAISGFFIAGLFFTAAASKSFWFRFVCILLWATDLLLSAFLVQGEFAFMQLMFSIYGVIFLNKMWKRRKEKMVQPPFSPRDLITGGPEIDLRKVGKFLVRILLVAVVLGIVITLLVTYF